MYFYYGINVTHFVALIAKHSRYVCSESNFIREPTYSISFNIQTMGMYALIIYFYIGIPLSTYFKKLYVML